MNPQDNNPCPIYRGRNENMRKGVVKKSIVFGIILLFFGTSIMPTTVGKKLLPDELSVYNELSPNETLVDDKLDQNNSDWKGGGMSLYVNRTSMGQSFKPTLNMITRVELILERDGEPSGDVILSIRNELNGTDLISKSIPASDIPLLNWSQYPNGNWVEFDFDNIYLNPTIQYYIILQATGKMDSNNRFFWGISWDRNPYPNGTAYEEYKGNWQETHSGTDDFCFKTYGYNVTAFFVMFGFMTVDGTIDGVFNFNNSRYTSFYCLNVSKVSVIGLGTYFDLETPESNIRFHMVTFTNVSALVGESLRKLEVSDEYQHFSFFATLRHTCLLLIYEQ